MSFQILVIANFSGREVADVKPRRIEADTLDEVMREIGPEAEVGELRLQFRELDDFHPDRLIGKLEHATVAAAAPTEPEPYAGGSLLDDLVAEQSDEPAAVEDADDLRGFLRRATAGHIVTREEVKADPELAQRLRDVLHHRAFQNLEAAWRGLDFLLRRCGDAAVSIVDLSLVGLLKHQNALRSLNKNYGVIVLDAFFDQGHTAAVVLERLGSFAKSRNATLLAGAAPPEGAGSEAWNQLRHSPLARHIGLVIPRFLLRLPYGRKTSQIDTFDFEEMPKPEHSQYLWGNGAYAAAALIGSAYEEDDPIWPRYAQRRIERVPLHTFADDGEISATPPAEIYLSEHDANSLLEAGLMPLASLKHEDAVLLVQFRSIADPPAGLACLATDVQQ